MGVASITAIIQAVFLRVGFFLFRMDKGIKYGAIVGAITAIPFFFLHGHSYLLFINDHAWIWLIIYAYIGAPIGAFL